MEEVVSFLSDLYENNNREWFNDNKLRYKQATAVFNDFAERLIEGISSFDPNVAGLTLKDCTYRIYRDVRFSKDKSPYKTHMGVYVCKGGKKSWNAGYYFHIQPKGHTWFDGHFISSGLYMPEPKALKIIREDISMDSKPFISAIKKAKDFNFNTDNKLKRIPAGFTEEDPFAEYIKQKDFFLEKAIKKELLFDKDLVNRTVELYRSTHDFVNLMNRAVDYSIENH